MKIVVNKRKLQVFLVVITLMAILFGVGEMLKEELKSVSFMQNDIKELRTFEALDGNISYKLPSKWTTYTETFPGGQIVYHNNFTSEDLLISGFVQVWNYEHDLKGFLDLSKKVSESQNEVKNYKITNIKVSGKEGYMINYTMKSRNIDYTVHEYFIKHKKGFVRFSFFTRSSNFREYMKTLYDSIVRTLEIKES
ncbi:PsbP-related protein [Clostridium sp.]|jgi:hypothetical protein|uniref:PsbP-related protein n=1 Tax=Clostridium sp. TaxID=1506 RepID=UPI0039F61679